MADIMTSILTGDMRDAASVERATFDKADVAGGPWLSKAVN